MKKTYIFLFCVILCLLFAACGGGKEENSSSRHKSEKNVTTSKVTTNLSAIDNTKWQYNEDDNVYYQVEIPYCETPVDENYETLSIFVPGAYMMSTENDEGTYTCENDKDAIIGDYKAESAPIVIPVNTPGYSAQSSLTEYTDVSNYMDAGFVYVHAGCRGRDEGAPAGVTDLKAAIRYIRYSDEGVPGDTEAIFTFGMSGGGAQSAIVGATGDSELYDPYLEEIGAVQGVSDATLGSMDWCPITNLDTGDAAYEWMLGVTRTNLSDDDQEISEALAEKFAEYINNAGLKDKKGNVLKLEQSSDGIYQAGSYYDYMKSVIEGSLNNFLKDTDFPYDASSSSDEKMEVGPGNDVDIPDGSKPDGEMSGGGQNGDNIKRNTTSSSGLTLSGTYETEQDYIDELNADGKWVSYDKDKGEVTISSIKEFVKKLKPASKNLGAFDQLDARQGENMLFGYGDGNGAHFDALLTNILSEQKNEYASDYESDLEKKDSAGNTVDTRLNMYTPLYYLLESQDEYQNSIVAKYWRIRSGINQGDCALSTEMNLALALDDYKGVESVDFETVWGQGHTQAERTGNSTDNFISWVKACTK